MRKSRQIIAYLGVSIDGRIAGMGIELRTSMKSRWS